MKRDRLTILFPWPDSVTYRQLSDETLHDLGIDSVCAEVTRNEKEQYLISRVLGSVTPDARVARYRTEVFGDILSHREMREKLMKLLDHVKFLNDYGAVHRQNDEATGLWDLLHRLDEINDYIDTVESVSACLDDATLRSQGLRELREGLGAIWQDSGFDGLKKDIASLKANTDNLKSITVGINLNERFEAVSLGLVSVNAKPFTRSNILRNFSEAIIRKDQLHADTEWNGDMSFHPSTGVLDSAMTGFEGAVTRVMRVSNPLMAATMAGIPGDTGARDLPRTVDGALNNLLSVTVRKLREVLNRHAAVSIREVADLIPELMYYIRWAEYLEKLTAKGWQFADAEAAGAEEAPFAMEARGFYNLKLIATEPPERVVKNDLDFGPENRVYLLTGANRGGKTTVTQAIGQLFLLAQGGIRVPAESFRYVPADGIFTHFPADEDKTLDLGRLGEECKRFRELYTECTDQSLLLLNETFSTTSFEEGYYIAADAVRAVLDKGTRTVYNTHMHKLAKELDTLNSDARQARALSLIVCTDGGERSFRIAVAPPEGMSYARDIAARYGVTYEELTGIAGKKQEGEQQ